MQAALGCEPLAAAARVSLAAGLDALPLKQLEAALGLVLPRMASGLWEGQQQQQQRQAEVGLIMLAVDQLFWLHACSYMEFERQMMQDAHC